MAKRVLIIDDDEDHLRITAKVLSEIGQLDVVTSSQSADAIQVIRQAKPDVLLLDIMMPKVDGFTICKLVKETPDLSHIKIIVYSAKIFEVDRKKALRLGADAYVSKVIESNKLIDTIREVAGA
jgi:CheY-like chemotaxis protein